MVQSYVVKLRVLDDGGGARVVGRVDQGQHLGGSSIIQITFNLRILSTLVAVGIHHLDLPRGGRDLSAGGNWRMVMSCSRFLTSDNVTPGADM